MSNVAYKKSVKTNGDYIDLAQEMGITFEVKKHYQIQLLNVCWAIIAPEKPTEGGFLIFNNLPFGYTQYEGSTLWIKSVENRPIEVNISEG